MKKVLLIKLVASFATSFNGQEKDYKSICKNVEIEKQEQLDKNGK